MNDLLDLPYTPHRSFSGKKYSGFFVGALTLAVAASLFFCQLRITYATVEQTVVTALVMLFGCVIMYTTQKQSGLVCGQMSPRYREAAETHRACSEEVRSRGLLSSLDGFCTEYVKEELRRARNALCERACLPAGYATASHTPETRRTLTRRQRMFLRRAERLKPLPLNASLLLSQSEQGERGALFPSGKTRAARTARALLPTLVGCFLTVSIIPDVTSLSQGDIIVAVARLFTLLLTGVKGYRTGYGQATEESLSLLIFKNAFLGAFLKRS